MIIDSHIHIPNVGRKKKNLFDIKNELLDSMKKNAIDYAIAIPMPDNVPSSKCAYTKTLVKIIEGEKQFFSMGTIDVFQKIDGQIKKLDNLLAAKKYAALNYFQDMIRFIQLMKYTNLYTNYVRSMICLSLYTQELPRVIQIMQNIMIQST